MEIGRLIAYLRLILVVFVGSIGSLSTQQAAAESKQSSQEGVEIVQRTDRILTPLLKLVPDRGLRNALLEYRNLINPDKYGEARVGSSNAGLEDYFTEKFSKNKCFQSAALVFYRDVGKILTSGTIEKDFEKNTSPALKIYGPTSQRARLSETAGKGRLSYLSDGWLKTLALKHAAGNPEDALMLIAMCGHDDGVATQGRFEYISTSEEALSERSKTIEKLEKLKLMQEKDLEAILQVPIPDRNRVKRVRESLKRTNKNITEIVDSEGFRTAFRCPTINSDFYSAGSLSMDADIDQSLKEKILALQSDPASPDSNPIPAKHYHVYSSAFLACKLVRAGAKPDDTVFIQREAARIYRGVRMCEVVKARGDAASELANKLKLPNLEDGVLVEERILEHWKNRKKICEAGTRNEDFDSICDFLIRAKIVDDETADIAIARDRIKKAILDFDVAKLYSDWYAGGLELGGIRSPCTQFRVRGPIDLSKPESALGRIFKPSKWSSERYAAATKMLKAWDVDFEWTVAQHQAGAKFGVKFCAANRESAPPAFNSATCESMPNSTYAPPTQSGRIAK